MPLALHFGREALANLLAGISYFYGPIRILNATAADGKSWYYDEPTGLFTATPSRPYFPRGFLWDEGFHSELTC
jgi:mannosyl-oligosaccharide glucosidase